MTEPIRDELHLWWLADPAAPRPIGRLRHIRRTAQQAGGVSLEYGAGWLADGIALSEDLPLREGEVLPQQPDSAVGAVDDARPDRWGERVIRLLDLPARLSTLEYLYYAGDDRFGALGVSHSSSEYLPRRHGALSGLADVAAIHRLVRQVEAGEPVEESLRRLVTPGATMGGARPKALLQIDGADWIIKFAEHGEELDSPLIEHAAMTLAAQAGIATCQTRALALAPSPDIAGTRAAAHALAIRRFDRAPGVRRHALSAKVALHAAGMEFGYPELALLLRRRGEAQAIAAQGEELFRRMVFNILIDNTDDHEKNHVLLAGPNQRYALSPAFDVLPAAQSLGYQQMRVGRDGAEATLDNALSEHRAFALTLGRAREVAGEVAVVLDGWQAHFAQGSVGPQDLAALARCIDRDFLLRQRRQAMGWQR